jgi:hypothetical protein
MNDNSLERRVALLETLVAELADFGTADIQNHLAEDAAMSALVTMVREMATHCGISEGDFMDNYRLRLRWWHDFHLRKAEDLDPATAARVDPRTIEQVDVSPGYPPLF